ncbi:hypothetical protein CU254_10780 [Amycolatopsis sp. AA4]|uniref:DUF6885 family protein n=1 Tax=Actinomycetes TaxID=1760 RepID=UPI0001B58008|nr:MULTISPECIES: hypothetical protein [Actinomycetes]ATY10900.1 hypothetical protein CU254_10780 [Amycolatopsis sp. AA4]EFL06439.1 predicted protein [Streptomyces sp. AA4]
MAVLNTGLSDVHWLPGGARLVAEARAELPQKDGLAAAFTGLVTLRAADIAVPDQDEVAIAAGTVRASASRPAGALPRNDFRLPVPFDETAAGTSLDGLATAIRTLSEGKLAVVPALGEWSTSTVSDLLLGLWELPRVAVLARVDPAELGSPDTPERALQDYLDTGIPPLWTNRWRPPAPHHVLLAGVRLGAEGTLLSVVDTYRELGDEGVHDQPVEWIAAGLESVLLVADARYADALAQAVSYAGLRTG